MSFIVLFYRKTKVPYHGLGTMHFRVEAQKRPSKDYYRGLHEVQ